MSQDDVDNWITHLKQCKPLPIHLLEKLIIKVLIQFLSNPKVSRPKRF